MEASPKSVLTGQSVDDRAVPQQNMITNCQSIQGTRHEALQSVHLGGGSEDEQGW